MTNAAESKSKDGTPDKAADSTTKSKSPTAPPDAAADDGVVSAVAPGDGPDESAHYDTPEVFTQKLLAEGAANMADAGATKQGDSIDTSNAPTTPDQAAEAAKASALERQILTSAGASGASVDPKTGRLVTTGGTEVPPVPKEASEVEADLKAAAAKKG